MALLAIFSLYTSRTITPSTWFALCHLDHSISSSDIYPGLSHCAEAVDPISLNNANAKRKAEPKPPPQHPTNTPLSCSSVLTRTGPLQDIWFGTKHFWAESVARQEATRCLTFKIKITHATAHVHVCNRGHGRRRGNVSILCHCAKWNRSPAPRFGGGGGICGGWEELANVATRPQRAPHDYGHSLRQLTVLSTKKVFDFVLNQKFKAIYHFF